MASRWIPSRSKIQDWILSKLIQFLTILQIISLFITGLSIPLAYANFDGSWVLPPQVSFYFSPYLRIFLEESEYNRIPAFPSIVFVNVCLIYCTWIEKTSFDYWKQREEKTGRCLLFWLNISGLVSDLTCNYSKVYYLCEMQFFGMGSIFAKLLQEHKCMSAYAKTLQKLPPIPKNHPLIANS